MIVVSVGVSVGVGVEHDFEAWCARARTLLHRRVPPDEVAWRDAAGGGSLFGDDGERVDDAPAVRLPKAFLDRARVVACHRDEQRWNVLYRLVWRIGVEGDRGLLDDAADPDVRPFEVMHKQVRFDAHKAKAFVRFRKVEGEGGERYISWHRPEHRVLPLVGPFFARRFGVMRWTIFTPHQSADWDGRSLTYGPGVDRDPLDARDGMEELWKTYYRNIFNPARIKTNAMLKEMPRRYWSTMPETGIIDELLREAPERVKTMMARQKDENPGAEAFLPPKGHRSLPQLRSAARQCAGCELCDVGTQTVFGEGPADARLMFVGEQPGDEEDVAGRPFVGPAGRLFDEALAAAGIDRSTVYVTNSVKHFRHEARGKRRIHMKPTVSQVRACLPWLRGEIEQVSPRVIVALGATAGQALLGRTYRVTQQRGELIDSEQWGAIILGTIHPSAILRMPDQATRDEAFEQFVLDLIKAAEA
ncbi:MAG: UdgX family uracil-DNA binding protein [Phycisphaerales bacterium]